MTTPLAPAPSALRHDGAEVVRVGDLVEADDKRRPAPDELPGVRVAEGLAEGDDALVVARAGGLVQAALPDVPGAEGPEPRGARLPPRGRAR